MASIAATTIFIRQRFVTGAQKTFHSKIQAVNSKETGMRPIERWLGFLLM
jgi:hypothetical protein